MKATKVLTKKLGRAPTDKELAKKVKKLIKKVGGDDTAEEATADAAEAAEEPVAATSTPATPARRTDKHAAKVRLFRHLGCGGSSIVLRFTLKYAIP